ncbi:MAG: hypothetical protein ACRED2_02165 [Methylocella sp.]
MKNSASADNCPIRIAWIIGPDQLIECVQKPIRLEMTILAILS